MYNPLLDPNKSSRNKALFGSWGGDPNGNNEIGRMFHDLSAAWYPISAQRTQFANQMEPGREAGIQQGLYNASPMGQEATAADTRNRLQAGAVDAGNQAGNYLAETGAGIGAQQGAHLDAMNNANRQSGAFEQYLASPEGQSHFQAVMQQLYGQAQDPGIGPLLQMDPIMEQRHQQNMAEQQAGGLGPIMGIIGQMAGGGAFNNIIHGPGVNPYKASQDALGGG